MAAHGAIDTELLNNLRALRQPGRPDPLARMMDVFGTETDRRLEELRAAVAGEDAATIERLAHSQKGSSGTMGALRVRDLAAQLERQAREGQLQGAGALVEELAAAYSEFLDYVRSGR